MTELHEIALRYRKEVERATGWACKGVMLSDFGKVPELVFVSPGWSVGTDMDDNAIRVNPVAQAKYEEFDKVRERFERIYREFKFGVAGYVRGKREASMHRNAIHLVGTPIAAYDSVHGWHMDDDSQTESLHIEFNLNGDEVLAFAQYHFWADHKISGKTENREWDDFEKVKVGVLVNRGAVGPAMERIADKFARKAKLAYSDSNWVMPGGRVRLNERGYKLQSVLRKTMMASVGGCMNRNMVAKELLAIAEELMDAPVAPVSVPVQAEDPWMTQEQVAEVCPACSQLMASKGIKRVRASVLAGKGRKAQWDSLPEGWTEASLKEFWGSLVGDRVHKVTACIKKMTGTGIDDPGAFCASLADRIEGKGWRSER